MASIVKKKRKSGLVYYISYRVPDDVGIPKQYWYPCKDKAEANSLLDEVKKSEKDGLIFEKTPASEYMKSTAATKRNMTVAELVAAYNDKTTVRKQWSPSTISNHESIARNYINPFIGSIKVVQLTPMIIQNYYDDLPKHKAAGTYFSKSAPKNISTRTVHEVHKTLHPALDLAVTWELLPYNPSHTVAKPIIKKADRERWSAEELMDAMNQCENELDYLCMAMMFACTLRSGELAGLTWDCVDVSEETIETDASSIIVNKALQRVSKEALKKAEQTGEYKFVKFPSILNAKKTMVVLKIPKTKKSNRRVYLPTSVAKLLLEHKSIQEQEKEFLGSDYHDYGIVTAQFNGNPYKVDSFMKHFKGFIGVNELRKVDFYSLRHSSVTEKLQRSHNVKAVQGDAGDATAQVIQDIYAGMVDEDRKYNAELMQENFFKKLKKETSSES